jgi:chromosome segregation ATPase
MSRIIVWTLVGLAVIAFAIFFLPQLRQGKKDQQAIKALSKEHIVTDAEAYDKYVSRSERDADRFSKRLGALKSRIGSMTAEQQTMLTNLEAKVGDFSAAAADLKNKTTVEEKDAAVTNVKNLRKEIMTSIRDLGGKTTSPSDT